ncbi:MAG: rRNA maturation RNase YbeY [Chlorobi bacterium]|nr:rRNA maturation RNase YbeY [Chlorobiota bacterium]
MKNVIVASDSRLQINKREIHKLIFLLTKELNFKISDLAVNFVNQATIVEINKTYLGHNYGTDVIAFGYNESLDNLDAEIFISYSDAAENARKYRVSLAKEITRLVIHGILHLTGYDDKKEKDKILMKKLENKLVSRYSMVVKNPVNFNDVKNS